MSASVVLSNITYIKYNMCTYVLMCGNIQSYLHYPGQYYNLIMIATIRASVTYSFAGPLLFLINAVHAFIHQN